MRACTATPLGEERAERPLLALRSPSIVDFGVDRSGVKSVTTSAGDRRPLTSSQLKTCTSAADMEAAIALGGQVVGRIDEVKPVAQIIDETVLRLPQLRRLDQRLLTRRSPLGGRLR